MSVASLPHPHAERPAATSAAPDLGARWAALAIATMWLTVLALGLWGGDIVSNASNTGGADTTVPSSVAVATFALVGTVVVGRRGFGAAATVRALEAELDEERSARQALTDEVAELQVRLAAHEG